MSGRQRAHVVETDANGLTWIKSTASDNDPTDACVELTVAEGAGHGALFPGPSGAAVDVWAPGLGDSDRLAKRQPATIRLPPLLGSSWGTDAPRPGSLC